MYNVIIDEILRKEMKFSPIYYDYFYFLVFFIHHFTDKIN